MAKRENELWDMDGDEGFAYLVSVVLCVVFLWKWYRPLLCVHPRLLPFLKRFALVLLPPILMFGLFVVIRNWSDWQVRDYVDYLSLFMFAGTAWLLLALATSGVLGVSYRDDVLERNNAAAQIAFAGLACGVMLIYAQSNVGNGPTIWTTLVPAAAGSLVLLVLWRITNLVGDAAELLTIERDAAAGWRQAAFAIAAGALLGRSLAGDFESWGSTWHDFAVMGWPSIGLAVVAGILHGVLRPTPARPRPSLWKCGVLPALVMLLATVALLWRAGAPVVKQ